MKPIGNKIAKIEGEIYYTFRVSIPHTVFMTEKDRSYWEDCNANCQPEHGFGAWNGHDFADRLPTQEQVIEAQLINPKLCSSAEGQLFSPTKVYVGKNKENLQLLPPFDWRLKK